MQRWFPFLVAGLVAAVALPVGLRAQSDADIAKVVKLNEEGAKKFVAMVSKITDEQWDYRVNGIRHTLGEEIEHVALSENDLQRAVERAMKTEPKPGQEDASKIEEMREFLLGGENLAENFKPMNKIVNRSEYEEFFGPAHARLIKLIRANPNPSNHFYKTGKFGPLSAYQLYHYIAFHRERHMRQMEALLSHPDMPGARSSAD